MYGDPDIICVSETHLPQGETMEVPGYKFYGNSRIMPGSHKSGGVAILVGDNLYTNYRVSICCMDTEGILALKLVHISTGYYTVVVSNYLPPSNSDFGRDPESFYDRLLLLTYEFPDADMLLMCGDFNSRIGSLHDVLDENEYIVTRHSVDEYINSHGKCMLNFLNDTRMCVVNGRFGPAAFTCHRTNGSSTVDYFLVPYEDLKKIQSMMVFSVEDIVNQMSYTHMLGPGSTLPDHDLLQIVIKSTGHIIDDVLNVICGETEKPKTRKSVPRKFHSNYMNNARIKRIITGKIDELLEFRGLQNDLDLLYTDLSNLIQEEMQLFKKVGKRRSMPFKPYWCPLLTCLWKEMKRLYDNAKKFLNSRDKRRLKKLTSDIPAIVEYRKATSEFDKELRKAKRKYQIDKIADLENLLKSGNHRNFWDAINKLGPRRKQKVTCEAYDTKGNLTRDPKIVEDLWYSEYSKLYGTPADGDFDEKHFQNIKRDLKTEQTDTNARLNRDLSVTEVERVVREAKKGKACGLDEIPYEALNTPLCITVLHKLFNLCFTRGVSPSMWSRCIILPIGKGNTSISTEPLSHRGLALQSCLYKLYSLILNRRLSAFMEDGGLLHETQNGLRIGRGCIDHVFTLSETVRMNLPTTNSRVFACFVDLRKAFPSVNRDLLLWKLRSIGVCGRIYHAIACAFMEPMYCVRVNGKDTPMFGSVLGLPEGDPNSPLCFSIFFDKLLQKLDESGLGIYYGSAINDKFAALCYADDLVLVASSEEKLQKQLDILHEYCQKWRLTVNVDKTKCMVFRRDSKCKHVQSQLWYAGVPIEQVS